MVNSRITDKAALLDLLKHIIRGGIPFAADIQRGEWCTTAPNSSPRKRYNGTASVVIRVAGGALDNGPGVDKPTH